MDTAGITSGTIVVTTFRNASLYTDYKTDTAGITSGKKRLLTLDFELDAAIHEANLFTTGSHATNTHTSGGKKNAVIHRGYH